MRGKGLRGRPPANPNQPNKYNGNRSLVKCENGSGSVLWKRLQSAVPHDDFIRACDGMNDPRFTRMAEEMLSPTIGGAARSLPYLAKQCGITYVELANAMVKRGLGDGLIKLSTHVEGYLDDTGRASRTTRVACRECRGRGVKVYEEADGPETCLDCNGTGKVDKLGDDLARKTMSETLGLTGKGGGVHLQINQAFNQLAEDSDVGLARLIEETDRAINVQAEEITGDA